MSTSTSLYAPVKPVVHRTALDEAWKPFAHGGDSVDEIRAVHGAHAALSEAERVIRTQQERIRHLEKIAMTDELTGLLNRRGFIFALQRELALTRRDLGARGILVMADLDGFKLINDMFGHGVGDDYLQAVAHALMGCVRSSDIVARLGGDEFALLITRMDEETGLKRVEKLEKTFNSRMMQWGDQTLPLRASFGLAPYSFTDTPEAIIAAADLKLYAQKAQRQSAKNRA